MLFLSMIHIAMLVYCGSPTPSLPSTCLISTIILRSRRTPRTAKNELMTSSQQWSVLELGCEVPSGNLNIAIENGHRNSEFSHKKWWFPIVM